MGRQDTSSICEASAGNAYRATYASINAIASWRRAWRRTRPMADVSVPMFSRCIRASRSCSLSTSSKSAVILRSDAPPLISAAFAAASASLIMRRRGGTRASRSCTKCTARDTPQQQHCTNDLRACALNRKAGGTRTGALSDDCSCPCACAVSIDISHLGRAPDTIASGSRSCRVNRAVRRSEFQHAEGSINDAPGARSACSRASVLAPSVSVL